MYVDTMRRNISQIDETAEALGILMQRESNAQRKQRLHAMASEDTPAGSHSLAVHRNSLGRWLSTYEQGGLGSLLRIGQPGAPKGQKSLSSEVMKALQQHLEEAEGVSSYQELKHWLEPEHQLKLPYKRL